MRNLEITTELRYSEDNFDFQDAMVQVVAPEYRTNGLYQYVAWDGESVTIDDLREILPSTLKRDLLIYALAVDWNYYSKTEIRKMGKQELIDLIQTDAEQDGLDLREYENWASDNNFAIGMDNYTFYKTRGYSQGDVLQYFAHNDIEVDEEFVSHICWDSTIYGTIRVSFDTTAINGVTTKYSEVFEFPEWTNCQYDISDLDGDGIAKYIDKSLPYGLTFKEKQTLVEKLSNLDYTEIKYSCAC